MTCSVISVLCIRPGLIYREPRRGTGCAPGAHPAPSHATLSRLSFSLSLRFSPFFSVSPAPTRSTSSSLARTRSRIPFPLDSLGLRVYSGGLSSSKRCPGSRSLSSASSRPPILLTRPAFSLPAILLFSGCPLGTPPNVSLPPLIQPALPEPFFPPLVLTRTYSPLSPFIGLRCLAAAIVQKGRRRTDREEESERERPGKNGAIPLPFPFEDKHGRVCVCATASSRLIDTEFFESILPSIQ